VKCTVALLLYQPFDPFGPAVTAAEIVGRVVSILTVTTLLKLLWFPARSVALAVAEDEPEALKVWLAGQVAIPDPPSAQVKLTVTGVVLFQPAAVGAGDAAATIVGAVLSILTVIMLLGALTFPALSVAVRAVDETAAPSVLSI
jgi:hypothetical protein